MSSCFVCGKKIDGDEAFLTFHINACLDKSSGSPPPPSPPQKKKAAAAPPPPPPTASSSSADEKLARQLAEEQDVQAALALEYDDAMELERVDPDRGAGDVPGCPLCESSWDELDIEEGDEDAMNGHAAVCGEEDAFGGGGGGGSSSGAGQQHGFGGFGRGAGSGKDDVVGTPGLIQAIEALLLRSHKDGKIVSANLCSPSIEHIKTTFKDWGWGCGYRNMMMIFSSLRHMDSYKDLGGKGKGRMQIPTIYEFQTLIEDAWREGYDEPGARHFKHKLKNSKKWIGTTEVYTALTRLNIRVRIVDFPKPKAKGSDGVHFALIRWIKSYFDSPLDPAPSGSTSKKRAVSPSPPTDQNALDRLMASKGSPVKMTKKQPLYLQHDGHSRTVVGYEVNKNGEWLLLFDPSKSPSASLKSSALSHDSNKRPKTSPPGAVAGSSSPASTYGHLNLPASFMAAAPGHGQIWEGKGKLSNLTSVWGHSNGGGGDSSSTGKQLEPFRVNLRNLSRRDQYQILYVEEGPMLSQAEKLRRKTVPSTNIYK